MRKASHASIVSCTETRETYLFGARRKEEIKISWNNESLGFVIIAFGLFDIVASPRILRRLRGKGSIPNEAQLFHSLRVSGLVAIVVGLAFVLGFFGRF